MTLPTGNDQGSKGVTLVEVLLAVVILSVGIAGVLQAYASAVKTLEISQENIDTVNLLRAKMAEIEQSSIEEHGVSAGSADGEFEGAFEGYRWESQIQPTVFKPLHEIHLAVSRQDGTRSFSFVTYEDNKDYEQKD